MDANYTKFHLVWSNDAPGGFRYMVHRMAMEALRKEGCQEVRVTLCGGTCQLAADKPDVQAGLGEMLEAGISLRASEEDVEFYKVREQIKKIGIDIVRLPGHWSQSSDDPEEKMMVY